MDVHRTFAQIAVVEDGLCRDEGKIGVRPEDLRAWAASLDADDEIASFSGVGRRWLRGQELPADEWRSVDALPRQLDFHNEELAAVDREIAVEAIDIRSWLGLDPGCASRVPLPRCLAGSPRPGRRTTRSRGQA